MYFVKRSFSGRYLSGFWLGMTVVLLHVVFAVGFLRMQIGEFKNSPEAFCPYYKWIMADTFWSLIFSLMIPFMAALGNSQMTYDDANSGFIMHVLQKKGKIGYVLGSLTSVYAVTFIETVLVLAADVMVVFLLLPNVLPDQVLNSGEGYSRLFTYHVEWMYSKPFKLILFYIILSGCAAGLFGMLTAVCGLYFSNRFTVMFSGFIIGLIFFVLANQQIVNLPSFLLVLPVMSQMYLPSLGCLAAFYLGCVALLFVFHKALVLGLAVSVLTFASVLSKCRANIAIGSKGDTELGRMFVASFSNLQYCELGLFPVFSAIFLLLLTDCGFEREMFVLKQPEKIGRLTRSKVFLACFMLTSGAILGLLVFAIFFGGKYQVQKTTFFCLAGDLSLFFLAWFAFGCMTFALENVLSKPLTWLLFQIVFLIEAKTFEFFGISVWIMRGLLIPDATSFGFFEFALDCLINAGYAVLASEIFKKTLFRRERLS